MKKLLIVLSALTVFASCKKEDVTSASLTPVPASSKNLAKSTYVYDNGTPDVDTYTYDAQGRISTYTSGDHTTSFDYVSASSLVATEKSNGNLINTRECELNTNGNVTKMTFKNSTGAVYYTYEYSYNTDGYLIKMVGYYPTHSDYEVEYTIANGNLVSAKNYNGGVFNYSGVYTYDNSLINKTANSTGYWPSYTLFGKASKNMLTEYKSTNAAATVTWHTKTSYVMDADGYPVKENTSYLLTGKQSIADYIYQ